MIEGIPGTEAAKRAGYAVPKNMAKTLMANVRVRTDVLNGLQARALSWTQLKQNTKRTLNMAVTPEIADAREIAWTTRINACGRVIDALKVGGGVLLSEAAGAEDTAESDLKAIASRIMGDPVPAPGNDTEN